ncbi:potassium-transporting ATPase subunit KdpC [Zavarzinia compransoris]|uniref:potassium-transporting ATPase subunit KdpC n=1 Tax=Zavarzinia marina TaxID=2911065 RepID=UPI001F3E790F|nr:potassium-transporting ATPase subunit KdpC [Zavarzinia marina]MCF4167722.1 potassium-transporting ATPase subunit KdpC [Zavarzinia marina]
MLSILRPALVLVAALTAITGGLYPALVTGLAGAVFPDQAHGSLAMDAQGRIIGSRLIGQGFAGDGYFHARPSAAGAEGWDAAAASGSNLGPTSKVLLDRVRQGVAAARADADGPVPVDLVTASGSGLDPDISPAAAYFQADRVARARGLGPAEVHGLIAGHIRPRQFGFLGEARVNVLELNLALDKMAP